MMQVTVKILVQSHQPFLLFIRLVQLRKLWTVRNVVAVLSSAPYETSTE